jgi:NAD(P)-dependent dehydrogenase (short-subunit alcohol dehydrogenase family)
MQGSMDELFGMRNRVAMVWGGGNGMGEATSLRVAATGAHVAVVDMDGAAAKRVAASIGSSGGKAVALTADVTNESDVNKAVESTHKELGIPELSASVVGIAGWAPVLQMTTEDWDRDHRINLKPAFFIARAVARVLVAEKRRGSLAFVASISGLQGAASHASYGAAKAGMMQLVKTMAVEWGSFGLRVNCVAPGPIQTQRIKASAEMDAILRRRIPLGRMGQIDEMAKCLLFLLSDMSSYVTGETIIADGGWMAMPVIHPGENPKLPAEVG